MALIYENEKWNDDLVLKHQKEMLKHNEFSFEESVLQCILFETMTWFFNNPITLRLKIGLTKLSH